MKIAGIELLLRQNKEGLIYGITYIDYNTKTVFNGSALGKSYSAKGLLERVGGQNISSGDKTFLNESPTASTASKDSTMQDVKPNPFWKIESADSAMLNTPLLSKKDNFNAEKFIEIFFRQEWDNAFLPFELKYNRSKKKRKRIND